MKSRRFSSTILQEGCANFFAANRLRPAVQFATFEQATLASITRTVDYALQKKIFQEYAKIEQRFPEVSFEFF